MNHLEQFWQKLLAEDHGTIASLIDQGGSWDDPLFGAFEGDAVIAKAIPELGSWYRSKTLDGLDPIQHLRTTKNDRRVVVESVLAMKSGLLWNQLTQKAEPAERFELPVAIVADRAPQGGSAPYRALRIYFGTWSVSSGSPKARIGPIAPLETDNASETISTSPTLARYFECLAKGDAEIIELFEPDGYFREPANNFACGRDQLTAHFSGILKLGGVGLDFLTATREGNHYALELQTVVWGPKRMDRPQAGFASYDVGPHGKLSGARVYDSVVPPEL